MDILLARRSSGGPFFPVHELAELKSACRNVLSFFFQRLHAGVKEITTRFFQAPTTRRTPVREQELFPFLRTLHFAVGFFFPSTRNDDFISSRLFAADTFPSLLSDGEPFQSVRASSCLRKLFPAPRQPGHFFFSLFGDNPLVSRQHLSLSSFLFSAPLSERESASHTPFFSGRLHHLSWRPGPSGY